MKYRITDQVTGKTLVISGDSPPTEQEAEELFQQSGIREATPSAQPRGQSSFGQLLGMPQTTSAQPQMTPQQKQAWLSKQVPLVPEMKIDPLTQMAGKTQQFLGESQTLPLIYSLLGRTIGGPVLGTGGGAAVGERLKQMAAKGGVESIVPTGKETKQMATTGAVYGGTDLLFKMLPYLNPFKTTGAIRDIGAANKTVVGDNLVSYINKAISNAPEPFKSELTEIAKKQAESWAGKTIAIKDLLNTKELANTIGRMAGGREGRTTAATFMNMVADAIRNELKTTAPIVSKADALFSLLFGTAKQAKRLLPWIVGGSIARGGLDILSQ